MGKLQASSLDRRFFHRLGASLLDRTICASAGSLGYEYTVGRGRLGADPMAVDSLPVHRQLGLEHGQHQHPPLEPDGRQARKRGRDDRHHRPLPEPDRRAVRLAHRRPAPAPTPRWRSGVMHVIWRDGLQDDDYLERATTGAALLRDRVLNEYPPERVAAITGRRRRDDRDARPPVCHANSPR